MLSENIFFFLFLHEKLWFGIILQKKDQVFMKKQNSYLAVPQILSQGCTIHYPMFCLKIAFCGISSGSILFAQAYLSEYIW